MQSGHKRWMKWKKARLRAQSSLSMSLNTEGLGSSRMTRSGAWMTSLGLESIPLRARNPTRWMSQEGLHDQHWLARSFDLKSACRQCAIHPQSRRFLYIVVGGPRALTLKAFRLKALPFGSVKSVHSFFRVSCSLWASLTSLFLVITSEYFDDFASIAAVQEALSVDYTVKAVCRLLGWKFAEGGPTCRCGFILVHCWMVCA